MVFEQPICPAPYPTSSLLHSNIAHEPVHNDALVYLAVAVATFAAVPSFLWLRDRRHKSRERRRNCVVVESIKAKMDTAKALGAVPVPVAISVPSAVDVADEARDTESVKGKKKRTKDRRKRNRDCSTSGRGIKTLASSRAPSVRRDALPIDYTPRAPEQSNFSPPYMPGIASPMPMSLISTSFHSSTLSSPSPSRSENSSQAGHSRSASASSTTAPLTPSSLPPSHSLPHTIIKANNTEAWALQLPRDDPAWDWDGQSSTYSSGSRAPSSSPCVRPAQKERLPSPPSPESPLMPFAPSLVFPSLNALPPPGASLATQIASLKGALEASRTREDMHRRDAERWSKECDIIKWKWNEANDEWRRREAEYQTQIHHLSHQIQTFTHPIHVTSPGAPSPYVPGQPPFPLAMTFPSLHHPLSPFLNNGMHPFLSNLASHTNENDVVNEELAEAILKRPGSIRPSPVPASRSRRGREPIHRPHAQTTPETGGIRTNKTDVVEPIVEFEFPTLLKRRVPSPIETVANVDGVKIYH